VLARRSQKRSPLVGPIALLVGFTAIIACGETRHAPGEACLRGDDCLSGFCTDRICVAAPPLGKPQTGGSADADVGPQDASVAADGASADARGD
jgi:hypothetical protein